MCGSSTIGESSATRSRATIGCSTATNHRHRLRHVRSVPRQAGRNPQARQAAADGRQGGHRAPRLVPHAVGDGRACASRVNDAGGYTTFCMGYPTTRGSVDSHARSLDSVVRSLEGISEINFVAHSLGNLVVRHWLKNLARRRAHAAEGPDVRPDGDARAAEPAAAAGDETHPRRGGQFRRRPGGRGSWPPVGKSLEPKLATPHFEFGILAGGKGDDNGYNPLIPGRRRRRRSPSKARGCRAPAISACCPCCTASS